MPFTRAKKVVFASEKVLSINIITQSLVSVKTCSGELLAVKLRTLYILDNWGCCKYSVVQQRCTYTFLKRLCIITSSTKQKCVRCFFCLFHVARCVLKWKRALWFTVMPVSGASAILYMFSTGFLCNTHKHTHKASRFPAYLTHQQISSLSSGFQGNLREIQWCR